MSWRAITVESSLADAVAAELLAMASEPETWTLENFGSQVFRVNQDPEVRFYFSPRAATVFDRIIDARAGVPCDPPLSKRLVPSRTSRLSLGFKSRWEPLQKPRLVSAPQGIPAAGSALRNGSPAMRGTK